jgi:hypothetical protein
MFEAVNAIAPMRSIAVGLGLMAYFSSATPMITAVEQL